MTHFSPPSNPFILEAFDCDLWCPVAQTLFHVADIESLRSILSLASDEDPKLWKHYDLDDEEQAAITARFGVEVDRSLLDSVNLIISVYRENRSKAPYLIHTNYELPLLLDRRRSSHACRMGIRP